MIAGAVLDKDMVTEDLLKAAVDRTVPGRHFDPGTDHLFQVLNKGSKNEAGGFCFGHGLSPPFKCWLF